MNLDVCIFGTFIILGLSIYNAKKSKGKLYDMGCECGKKKLDVHAEEDCKLSAKLEDSAPTPEEKYQRIVGGCEAGHTPWFALIILTEGHAWIFF